MPETITIKKKAIQEEEQDEIVAMFKRGLEDLKAGRVRRVR